MAWPDDFDTPLRREAHFDGRMVRCFTERPNDIDARFRAVAAQHGAREALVLDETRLSYRELDRAVAAVAGNLAARYGIGVGDRVALYSGNCVEFVTIVLACARLGAISVPLGHRLQTPELEYMIGHSGAKLLAVEAALADRVPARAALPDLAAVVAFEGDAPGCDAFAPLLAPATAPVSAPDIDEESVAAILYTSGTTGRSKGATLTHFNIIHTVLHYQHCMGMNETDRTLMAVPITHVTGMVAQLLSLLNVGGCVVMMREFKARAALEVTARERITHSIMVPAMYNLMLREPGFESFDLSAMKMGGFGGAPMPEATIAELQRRLPNLTLRNAYGATETTSPTTIMPPGRISDHRHTVGLPVPCADVLVVDETGREVPTGETGEIWIAGPMVVPGYWDNPEANASEFTGGYWHSGDIGRLDADGYLEIRDRIKDMINRAGYKVFSAEVENVLAQHPAVAECAVVGRPDPVLGERVHAFVVPAFDARGGEAFSAEAVKRYCAERLADYKVPEAYTTVDGALPRNANGKIMKPELRRRAIAETAARD